MLSTSHFLSLTWDSSATWHGDLGKIKNRSIEEIAKYIGTIDQATGENSSVRKVSLIPCNLEGEYVIAVNAFYFWSSIFINRKSNIIMLVCIRIYRDYFAFFIERISFFKSIGTIS
jgi:hypothetical protein